MKSSNNTNKILKVIKIGICFAMVICSLNWVTIRTHAHAGEQNNSPSCNKNKNEQKANVNLGSNQNNLNSVSTLNNKISKSKYEVTCDTFKLETNSFEEAWQEGAKRNGIIVFNDDAIGPFSSANKDSAFFKGENLLVPKGKNVTLQLNGHRLINPHSAEPVINLTNKSGLKVEGFDKYEDQYGFIDGVFGDSGSNISLHGVDFRPQKMLNQHFVYVKGKDEETSYLEINKCNFTTRNSEMPDMSVLGAVKVDDCHGLSRTVVNNSNFHGVHGDQNGGAINSNSDLEVKNTNFVACNVVNADGGAIFHKVSSDYFNNEMVRKESYPLLKIDNCTFNSCMATGGKGGAIYHEYNRLEYRGKDGTAFLNGASFTDNFANVGGAVYNKGEMNLNSSVSNNQFSKNMAVVDGGAIFCTSYDAKWLADDWFGKATHGCLWINGETQFVDNKANNNGGAICSETNTRVKASTNFSGNHACHNGGAIYFSGNDKKFPNPVKFLQGNIDLLQNSAEDSGGAVYCAGHFECGEKESTKKDNICRININNNTANKAAAGVYAKKDVKLFGSVCISKNSISKNTSIRSAAGIDCGHLTIGKNPVKIENSSMLENVGENSLVQDSNAYVRDGQIVDLIGCLDENTHICLNNDESHMKLTASKEANKSFDSKEKWRAVLENSKDKFSLDRLDNYKIVIKTKSGKCWLQAQI